MVRRLKNILFNSWAILTLTIGIVGCGGDAGTETTIETREGILSLVPLEDVEVNEGDTVSFTANGSFSGGNPELRYSWDVFGGDGNVDLGNTNSQTLTFVTPEVGSDTIYIVEVTLSAEGFIPSDFLSGYPKQIFFLTVNDTTLYPPDVEFRSQMTAVSGKTFSLDGSRSSDRQGIVAYLWEQSSGPPIDIFDYDSAVASVDFPVVDSDTVYAFDLTVSNNIGLSTIETFEVTLRPPQPPVVNFSTVNNEVISNNSVNLSASGSTADIAVEFYEWRQVAGPDVDISALDQSSIRFTTPMVTEDSTLEFEVTVTDDRGLSTTESFEFTLRPENQLPEISFAENEISVQENNDLILDGSMAVDPDGTLIEYRWMQVSGPSIEITDAGESIGSISAPDVYTNEVAVFSLTVTDDRGGVSSAELTVNIEVVLTEKEPPMPADLSIIAGPFTATYYTEPDSDFPVGEGTDGSDSDIVATEIFSEEVEAISLNYSVREFHDIHAENFYGVWEGDLEVLDDHNFIYANFSIGHSDILFYVNDELIDRWENHSKIIPLELSVGTHKIRVEYHNHWFGMNINIDFTTSAEETIAENVARFSSYVDEATEVVQVTAHSTNNIYNEASITLPNSDLTLILFLSSYESLRWNIINPHNTKIAAVAINSYEPGSSVRGIGNSPVKTLNDLSRESEVLSSQIENMIGLDPFVVIDVSSARGIEIEFE